MNEVKDFTFLKEMDVDSLEELFEAVKQQIEEKGGQVNQLCPEQVDQLTEQVKQLAQQVNQVALQVDQFTKQVKQPRPVEVNQQVKGQLCPEPVKQFEKQCMRRLEANEYGARQSIGVSTTILYKMYEIWCEVQGIECIAQKTFTIEIKKLGYIKARGKCLVKAYATGQLEDRQQVIFHNVPKIQEQVRARIHEKLTEREWTQDSKEYQQLHALEVWFNKEDE